MRLGEVLLAVALPAQILTQGRELPQRALGDFVTSFLGLATLPEESNCEDHDQRYDD